MSPLVIKQSTFVCASKSSLYDCVREIAWLEVFTQPSIYLGYSQKLDTAYKTCDVVDHRLWKCNISGHRRLKTVALSCLET